MWFSRSKEYDRPNAYLRRTTTYVDRDFQLRHTRYILFVALLSSGTFLLPILLLTNQNYALFMKLADVMSPGMAKYIAKEHLQINVVFAFTLIAYGIFWTIFGKKMTAKIAGPIKVLRNHMRLISRGDYTLDVIRLREDDEFKELINTYNSMYKILQTQNERDLNTLRNIISTVTNPVARDLLSTMIEEHQLRQQQPPQSNTNQSNTNPIFLNDEAPSATRDSRHAS